MIQQELGRCTTEHFFLLSGFRRRLTTLNFFFSLSPASFRDNSRDYQRELGRPKRRVNNTNTDPAIGLAAKIRLGNLFRGQTCGTVGRIKNGSAEEPSKQKYFRSKLAQIRVQSAFEHVNFVHAGSVHRFLIISRFE